MGNININSESSTEPKGIIATGAIAEQLKQDIIKYAKEKCREQREICSKVESIGYRIETTKDESEHRADVLNAPEPKF